jgi:hypothetical protein
VLALWLVDSLLAVCLTLAMGNRESPILQKKQKNFAHKLKVLKLKHQNKKLTQKEGPNSVQLFVIFACLVEFA